MDSTPAPQPLLTIDELAAYLGIKKHTLYKTVGTPAGPPAMKIGGALRFRLADIDAWLATQALDRS